MHVLVQSDTAGLNRAIQMKMFFPTGSFPCKTKSSSQERLCIMTCFETEAQDNLEMTYSERPDKTYMYIQNSTHLS